MQDEIRKMGAKKKIVFIALAMTALIILACTSYRAYFLLFGFNQSGFWDAIKYGLVGGNRYKLPDNGPPAGLAAPLEILAFLFAPIIACTLALPIQSWQPWPMIVAPAFVPIFILALYLIIKKVSPKKRKMALGPLLFLWLIYAYLCTAAIIAVMSI